MPAWKHFEIALRVAEIWADQKSVRLAFNISKAVLDKGDDLTIKEIIALQVENEVFFESLYDAAKGLVEEANPKKSGFQERLDAAMAEQKRIKESKK